MVGLRRSLPHTSRWRACCQSAQRCRGNRNKADPLGLQVLQMPDGRIEKLIIIRGHRVARILAVIFRSARKFSASTEYPRYSSGRGICWRLPESTILPDLSIALPDKKNGKTQCENLT